MQSADVIIVGAGVNGAATAHYLAERGIRDVVVVESQYPAVGASSRGMGLLRQYHSTDAEARLAIESLQVFRGWADQIGGTCGYNPDGFIWLDDARNIDQVRANADRLTRLGANARLVDAAQIQSLQPHMSTDGTIGCYEPEGGSAYGALATDAWLRSAQRRGVRLLTHTPVRALLTDADGRISGVNTDSGVIASRTVVVAAGAWGGRLLSTIGISLPIEPRRLTTGRILLPEAVQSPVTFLDGQYDTSFRVDRNNTAIISMRDDGYGAPIDLDKPLDDVAPWARSDGRERISRRIPALATAPTANTWTGLDGFTPDYKGIYGRIDGVDGLYIIGGASEKGFKVSPAVGRGTAALIAGDDAELICDPAFSASRFDSGASGQSGWIAVGELL